MPSLRTTSIWSLSTTPMSKLSRGQFPASLRDPSRWSKSWSNTCMPQLLMQTLRLEWGAEGRSCHGTLRVLTRPTICTRSLTIPSRKLSWRSVTSLAWVILVWTQLPARICPGQVPPPTWAQEAYRIIHTFNLRNKSLAKMPPWHRSLRQLIYPGIKDLTLQCLSKRETNSSRPWLSSPKSLKQ